jgi:hypothetical protein
MHIGFYLTSLISFKFSFIFFVLVFGFPLIAGIPGNNFFSAKERMVVYCIFD